MSDDRVRWVPGPEPTGRVPVAAVAVPMYRMQHDPATGASVETKHEITMYRCTGENDQEVINAALRDSSRVRILSANSGVCDVNWGSHGCNLDRDHDGEHRCSADCGMTVDPTGHDTTGFKWDLWGSDVAE